MAYCDFFLSCRFFYSCRGRIFSSTSNDRLCNFAGLRSGVAQYLPFGILIGLVIFIELILAFVPWDFKEQSVNNLSSPINLSETNTVALGKVVYTDYFLLFQCAGIILLIAMIGSIVLTLRSRPDVKRQNITEQLFQLRFL